MRKYKTAVVIGRFSPLHRGHECLIQTASELAESVVVVIGSAFTPQTPKNPWDEETRAKMIRAVFPWVKVGFVGDQPYNDPLWAADVVQTVTNLVQHTGKTVLVGHKKDDTEGYLSMFPQWDFFGVEQTIKINATAVRDCFWAGVDVGSNIVSPSVKALMALKEEDFRRLVEETRIIRAYKEPYASLPYRPIFVTVDAVVVQSGHVLLIKRRSAPGRGLWALPGGFVNAETDVSIKAACLRELVEETRIKVPEKVLEGSMIESKVFDAIGRSSRGRTITHAFLILLKDSSTLPKVKGSDDAETASWVPLNQVDSRHMFEDHYHIIQTMVGRI